jgi:hypothetical protein
MYMKEGKRKEAKGESPGATPPLRMLEFHPLVNGR